MQKRSATAAAADHGEQVAAPLPLRVPADLRTFPWDLAKTELGFAGADLLALLAMLVVRLVNEVKDQRLGERPLAMQGYGPTGRDS